MKIKTFIPFLFVFTLIQTCKAQKTQNPLPKVENHLKGVLDYTHEALELVQNHINGEEVILGKINKDGTVHFNLPEFNVKAQYESIPLQNDNFQSMFLMKRCKDKDVFADTPYDAIYAKKYDPIYVKKYGINVAVLEPATNKKMLDQNKYSGDSISLGSSYFWLYIDRAIAYKDECIKTSFKGTYDIEVTVNANIEFEKGWNFIEENLVEIQSYSKGDFHTNKPKKIQFTKSLPASKEVKWFLRKIQEDEKIETAKRLDKLTPITKGQFEKWAPNKLGDLSVTTKEHGIPPQGQKNKNNMHLTYVDETQKKEIDLYVVDCAKNPDGLEMVNFAYAMENDEKEQKDVKPYVAQYNERTMATQLLYKVEDRLFVNASGKNINSEELWDYIKKLNVEKLLEK